MGRLTLCNESAREGCVFLECLGVFFIAVKGVFSIASLVYEKLQC